MHTASFSTAFRPRRRRWLTEVAPDPPARVAAPERVVTARIRSAFCREGPGESSDSTSSERTDLTLLSVSEDPDGRVDAPKERRSKSLSAPSRATSSAPSRVPSRLLDRERAAERHLDRLVRQLSAVSGSGDERYEVRSEFVDDPRRLLPADYARRAWYPQNLRLTPRLAALVRADVLRRMDVRRLPPVDAHALLCLDLGQPAPEEARAALLDRWLSLLPDSGDDFEPLEPREDEGGRGQEAEDQNGSRDEAGEANGSRDETGDEDGSRDEAGDEDGSRDEAGNEDGSRDEVGEANGSRDEAGNEDGSRDEAASESDGKKDDVDSQPCNGALF